MIFRKLKIDNDGRMRIKHFQGISHRYIKNISRRYENIISVLIKINAIN